VSSTILVGELLVVLRDVGVGHGAEVLCHWWQTNVTKRDDLNACMTLRLHEPKLLQQQQQQDRIYLLRHHSHLMPSCLWSLSVTVLQLLVGDSTALGMTRPFISSCHATATQWVSVALCLFDSCIEKRCSRIRYLPRWDWEELPNE